MRGKQHLDFAEPMVHEPVDDSLVLWFRGSGSRRAGTVLADLSKKGHHGTLVGSPPWKNTPLGHSVLDFPGTDEYIEVADHNDFSFGDGSNDSPFSVSAWINMDSVTGFPIVSKYIYGTDNREWRLDTIAGNKLSFTIYELGSTTEREGKIYDTALSRGQWYHVVATYDGRGGDNNAHDGMKIYVDGVRKDDTDSNFGVYTAMSNGTAPVHIGKFDANYSDGKIDDVRIYRKELKAGEVSNLYNETRHYYGL